MIKFTQIADTRMNGKEARIGNKHAEVICAYEADGLWLVCTYVDGKHVKIDDKRVNSNGYCSYRDGMAIAKDFLITSLSSKGD